MIARTKRSTILKCDVGLTSQIIIKSIVGAIFCGVLVSLATGIIENSPGFSIIGARYYGYPLVWRVTMTLQPQEFRFVDLAIDVMFWIIVSLVALIILMNLSKHFRRTSSGTISTVGGFNS